MKFEIKKGNHYSNEFDLPLPQRIKSELLGRYDCTIEFKELPQEPQDFYSKLIGVCHILGTRYNSERIGWRYVGKQWFEFCFFSEKNKKFEATNKVNILAIKMYDEKDGYYYSLPLTFDLFSDRINFMGETKKYPSSLCFLAKPYFGGNPSADQNYTFNFNKHLTN